jgi:hypothetical protein
VRVLQNALQKTRRNKIKKYHKCACKGKTMYVSLCKGFLNYHTLSTLHSPLLRKNNVYPRFFLYYILISRRETKSDTHWWEAHLQLRASFGKEVANVLRLSLKSNYKNSHLKHLACDDLYPSWAISLGIVASWRPQICENIIIAFDKFSNLYDTLDIYTLKANDFVRWIF